MQVKHTFVSPKAEQTDPTLVGPNEWNATHTIIGFPLVIASDFNFTPYAPGTNLIVGSNSIVFPNPLPSGLSIGSSLYISGGVGTAEVVPITGITGNTVIVTCANTHGGAWNIQSSSGGLQEAICSLPAGGGEVIVNQSITLQANINVCSKNFVQVNKWAGCPITGGLIFGCSASTNGHKSISNYEQDFGGSSDAFTLKFNDTVDGVGLYFAGGSSAAPMNNTQLALYNLIFQDVGADAPGSVLTGMKVDYRMQKGTGHTCFAFYCNAQSQGSWTPSTAGGGLVTNGPIGAGINAYSQVGGYVAAALFTATADTVVASSVSGMEINISNMINGSHGKAGILIVDFSTGTSDGVSYAYSATTASGGLGFMQVLNFIEALDTGGTILKASNTKVVANGIDFSTMTFSGQAFKSPGFAVNGAGDTSVHNLFVNQFIQFQAGNATGAGSALLGTNCPAITLSAPYKWLQVTTADGSTAYIPAWK